MGGLALLFPGAAIKNIHISSAAHYLKLIFGCGIAIPKYGTYQVCGTGFIPESLTMRMKMNTYLCKYKTILQYFSFACLLENGLSSVITPTIPGQGTNTVNLVQELDVDP